MDWTKPGSFSSGRDPLGFQAASVRLYTSLVPGLTNVTNRLRYYSYYCWVLWQFEQLHHSSREDRWIEFIRRAEYVFALACQVGDRENATGMAGSDWAGTEANRAELDVFDLISPTDRPGKDGQYLKAKYGNFGQFYVASMLEMEMISQLSGRIYGVTAGVGRPMAQAVQDENGPACNLVMKAIERGSVSRSDCVKISDALHPANIIGTSQEAALLRVFLEGGREDDRTGLQRRTSLKNVLTVVSGDTNRLELRAGLYAQDWRSDGATGYDDNLNSWRAYFVNEFCHIALEVWLNAVVGVANGGSALSVSEIARRTASKAVGEKSSTVRELADSLALSTFAEEDELASSLEDAASTKGMPDDEAIMGAATMILSMWHRWRNETEVRKALSRATVEGRSAEGLFQFLDRVGSTGALEALTALIGKFVIANHLIIAGHKLATGGRLTYRFALEDGCIVDGEFGEYTFTTPRIFNLLTFARDALLVESDSDTLTDAGKEFLRAA